MNFGKLDARYETVTRDPRDREHFKASFLEPAGLSVEDYLNGQRYFVHGMKGSGKTALLRYVQMTADASNCITKFISFASDVTEHQRERLAVSSGIEMLNQGDIDVEQNAIDFWMLTILRALARIIEENRKAFTTHRDVTQFIEIVRKVYDGETNEGMLAWLSKVLRSGKYRLKSQYFEASLKGKAAEAEQDFPIDVIVSKCCSLLRNLSFEGHDKIYLFYDELNLALTSKAQHRRDATLIRDLVLAVDRLNTFFTEENKPIYILAAIRSEVLNTMNTPVHEINKMLSDRGKELRWFARTAGKLAPIVDLVETKLSASERAVLSSKTVASESKEIWSRYFHSTLFDMLPADFIVEMTWCNPRDLVMLLGRAASEAGNDHKFDEGNINRILEHYSAEAWKEKVDELNVEYAQTEIQSIKKIFAGFKCYFRTADIELEAKRKGNADQNVQQLFSKKKVEKVLEDLYRVGVLGQADKNRDQSEENVRSKITEHWAYRGDQTFDLKASMVVHRALWPELRLGKIKPNRGGGGLRLY